jgi:hypothetical protein
MPGFGVIRSQPVPFVTISYLQDVTGGDRSYHLVPRRVSDLGVNLGVNSASPVDHRSE